MRTSPSRGRSGITLTEILISILIMGIGLISLATLFPLGLERIRRAQRNVRSAQLVRSALADVDSRNLFGPTNFQINPWVYPAGVGRDPWITDWNQPANAPVAVYRGPGVTGFNAGAYVPGEGLPVVYDPLWWAQLNYQDADDRPEQPDLFRCVPLRPAGSARFGSTPTAAPPAPTGSSG